MLEHERSLLVAVALDARGIGADRKLRLLLLKAAMRVVAITTIHRSFEDSVTERLAELCLGLGMARHAELRFVRAKHGLCRLPRFVCGYVADECG